MSLDDILVFSDDEPTKSTKPIKSKKQSKPKKQSPSENVHVNHVYEMTLSQLEQFFENKKKLPKKTFNFMFKGKKSILGSLLKENDIFLEVAVLNVDNVFTTKFISMSFKFMAKRELKAVSKKYTIIDPDKRYPLLVEAKYMDLDEYSKQRDKIYKQFL